MGMGELLAIAVGVSMDAFAIAICKGAVGGAGRAQTSAVGGALVRRGIGFNDAAWVFPRKWVQLGARKPGPLGLLRAAGSNRSAHDPGIPGARPEDGGLLCAQGHAAAGSCRQH